MRRTIIIWMLGALVLVGAAAGCGAAASADDVASVTDGAAADSAGTTTTTQDPKQAMLDFVQCMREHGIDMEDPTVNADGGVIMKGPRTGDPEAMKAADHACADLRPKAGGDGARTPDPEQEAKMRENALAFAACMREHGIDMPDPQFGDGTMSMSIGEGNNPDDPAFQEAQKACEPIMAPPDGAEGGPVKGAGPVTQTDGGGPELGVSGGEGQ